MKNSIEDGQVTTVIKAQLIKPGFLLMEILIALVILALVMLTVTRNFGAIAQLQRETVTYLKAVDYMHRLIGELPLSKHSSKDSFTATVRRQVGVVDCIDYLLGFSAFYPTLVTHDITVAWLIGQKERSITCSVFSTKDPQLAAV